jgi:alkylation response protein AidB-like acyl-CoA dehydrogenase
LAGDPRRVAGQPLQQVSSRSARRGQATAELFLDDVRVPASTLLGEEGQGFKIAMTTFDKGRVWVAAGCVGIVQDYLEPSVAYATSRTQFGRPLAGFQPVQDMMPRCPSTPTTRGCWGGGAPI